MRTLKDIVLFIIWSYIQLSSYFEFLEILVQNFKFFIKEFDISDFYIVRFLLLFRDVVKKE